MWISEHEISNRRSDNGFTEIKLTVFYFQDVLLKLTGARSVPRVFIRGKCIGGGDDTVAAQKNGRLEKMLKEAGVI